MQHLKTALIFADGKLGVGLGHISRCSALKEELESQNFKAELLDSTLLDSFSFTSYDLIAIDSYILPLESYILATQHAKICLFFDDTLRLDYPKGIIINNASGVNFQAYAQKYKNHTLFLGDKFTLLQQAFKLQTPPKLNPTLKRCLITLGGEDILKLNTPIASALLSAFPNLEIHCITKDSKLLPKSVITRSNLSAKEMAQHICAMDFCVCACGQSLREILSCGIPAIALEVAANQNANLKSFKSCTLNLPKTYQLSHSTITKKIIDFVESYQDLTLRQKHQTLAQSLLKHQNLWQSALKNF
ncbi:hypothetical protein LS70_001680 [Helicobacter sp. MIT 11-5569]|uniref:hypothetical protein n=1 Tax=Helicobacter sp. MIT 11-5569 TaxID=1548151 RepID=UPI00051FEBE4|nr:hypothetical protein [Helicobacter sp. MIT 11-5569]TLD85284.1 hypothetical protein LS70_001680 [Helicobacter sp. MIT 11-5569]